MSVTDAWNKLRRSNLSTRQVVMREANRRGLLVGILSRGGRPIGRAEARLVAAESATGADPFHNCAISPHWQPLFKRVFAKAAVHAANTERPVAARSR